jgi:hypothetical protein
MFLEGASIRAPSAEHKVLEMGIWKSESAMNGTKLSLLSMNLWRAKVGEK